MLRQAVDWSYPEEAALEKGLQNNLYLIYVEKGGEIVG